MSTVVKQSDGHSDICKKCVSEIAKAGERVGADFFEGEDGFEVWLTHNACKMMALIPPTACKPEAALVASALRQYLQTPKGQRQAVQYVRHRVGEMKEAA